MAIEVANWTKNGYQRGSPIVVIPLPVTYAAAGVGQRWTASARIPGDRCFALIGLTGSKARAKCHTIDTINDGSGNICKGTVAGGLTGQFMASALVGGDSNGGPVIFPGPGVRNKAGRVVVPNAAGMVLVNSATLTVSGIRVKTGSDFGLTDDTANLGAILVDLGTPQERPDDLVTGRPVIVNVSATKETASTYETSATATVTTFGGGTARFVRAIIEKFDTVTPVQIALDEGYLIAIEPLGYPAQRVPVRGKQPGSVMAGTEPFSAGTNSPDGGLPSFAFGFDVRQGNQIKVDINQATGDGVANLVRWDNVILGYEMKPSVEAA